MVKICQQKEIKTSFNSDHKKLETDVNNGNENAHARKIRVHEIIGNDKESNVT